MSVWTRDDWKDFLWALKTIKVIKANIKWKANQLADTGTQLKSQFKKAQSKIHSKTRNKIMENQRKRLQKMARQNEETIIMAILIKEAVKWQKHTSMPKITGPHSSAAPTPLPESAAKPPKTPCQSAHETPKHHRNVPHHRRGATDSRNQQSPGRRKRDRKPGPLPTRDTTNRA